MFPAKIDDYQRPTTVADALAAIANCDDGEAVFLAGGQSLMQAIKSRMVRPTCIVDLQSVTDLCGINQSNGLHIGAMTRYVEIAQCESLPTAYLALSDAARRVGDRQVRNRGTIGGSVCWNYVASCMPSVVLALNGTLSLASTDGAKRQLAAEDFMIGPFETAREENEILLSVAWDKAPEHTGSAYKKWGLVTDALPVVGMCITVTLDDDRCSAARVAVAGLADGAQLVAAGGAALIGSDGGSESIAAAMNAVVAEVETHSDHWADAAYREQLIRSIGTDVAALAFARARV